MMRVHALYQQSEPEVSPLCILHNNRSFLRDVGDSSGARHPSVQFFWMYAVCVENSTLQTRLVERLRFCSACM